MNVRQVQKSIVPILLLQLIGEFFFFFFVHIIMDDSRERLAVFSWSLCGSLVIHGGWWWSVGNGLVWSLRGADENQNIQRANKRWKDLIPIGQLMTSILSFSGVVHLLCYTYSVIHLSKEIALMLLVAISFLRLCSAAILERWSFRHCWRFLPALSRDRRLLLHLRQDKKRGSW